MEIRPDFENFKSHICHQVKNLGDIDFIIKILESNDITKLYDKKWYPECFYLLAMLDYLSRINKVPYCINYNYLRCRRMEKIIYPVGILILSELSNNDEHKKRSLKEAIPEFMRHNIVESEIRNIC